MQFLSQKKCASGSFCLLHAAELRRAREFCREQRRKMSQFPKKQFLNVANFRKLERQFLLFSPETPDVARLRVNRRFEHIGREPPNRRWSTLIHFDD